MAQPSNLLADLFKNSFESFVIILSLKFSQNLNEQSKCESYIFYNVRLQLFVLVYEPSWLNTFLTALADKHMFLNK